MPTLYPSLDILSYSERKQSNKNKNNHFAELLEIRNYKEVMERSLKVLTERT